MAAIDDIRGVAFEIRKYVPESLGLRTTRVIVRTRVWSGGRTNLGYATVTDLEIDPRPLVRELDGDRTIRVGPVTPSFSGCVTGGLAYADLVSDAACGTERYFRVIGENGERQYGIVSIDTSKETGWTFVLSALERVLPF